MRVFGTLLVGASILGLVVALATSNPGFLGVELSGHFEKLIQVWLLAIYFLSVATLLIGVKLAIGRSRRRAQGAGADSFRGSHPYNK
jgi:hypothetical protein